MNERMLAIKWLTDRMLAVNKQTGNFVDEVAAAYRRYVADAGDLPFQQWHDSKLCPRHEMCSACAR